MNSQGVYERIDGDGFFRAAVTSMHPGSKGSSILHPDVSYHCNHAYQMVLIYSQQKRVLTIREYARAQGFPDHWMFMSESDRTTAIFQDVGVSSFSCLR